MACRAGAVHPFDTRLDQILDQRDFGDFVEIESGNRVLLDNLKDQPMQNLGVSRCA